MQYTKGMMKMQSKWSNILGYFIIVCVMVAGFAYLDVRREDQSAAGRQILCTGIIANTNNVARDDVEVVKLCRAVDVDREDYPDTVKP